MKKTVRTVQVFWEEELRVMVRRHQTVANYANDRAESSPPPDETVEEMENPALKAKGENNEK